MQANEAIRDEVGQVRDWLLPVGTCETFDLAALAQELYRWIPRLNERFFDNTLPQPVLSFGRTSVRVLGHFRVGYNEMGLRYQINLNERYLSRSLAEVLETLCHELGHAWEQHSGIRAKSRGYHTMALRDKMGAIGIHCDQQGRTISVDDPFLAFLAGVRSGWPCVAAERADRSTQAPSTWAQHPAQVVLRLHQHLGGTRHRFCSGVPQLPSPV